MKERELRELATCANCGKKIGSSGLPLFWTVTIERHGLKVDAIQRQQGLALMLGGRGDLAQVLGPDEDMTMPMMDPVTVSLCENCGCDRVVIAALAEKAVEKALVAEEGKNV